jgi:uncharacterized membrane protein
MSIALFVHLAAAVIWVGGMFFAYVCLRPAAATVLEAPSRLQLWRAAFTRFFPWVWGAVIVLPLSGYWMLFRLGGFADAGIHIHIMHALGIIMILVFLHIYFAPYRRLQRAVDTEDYPTAGRQLNLIRKLVATNLTLGLLVLAAVRLLR